MRDKCFAGFFLLFLTNFEIFLWAKSLEPVQGVTPLLASGLLFEGRGGITSRTGQTSWTLPINFKPLPAGTIVDAEIFWDDGGADLGLTASFKGKRQDETSKQINAKWARLSIEITEASLLSLRVGLIDHISHDLKKSVEYRLHCLIRQKREEPKPPRMPASGLLSTKEWTLRGKDHSTGSSVPFDWWKVQPPSHFSEAKDDSFVSMLHVILKPTESTSAPIELGERLKRQPGQYSFRIFDWTKSSGLRLRKVASTRQSSRLECFLDVENPWPSKNFPQFLVRVGYQGAGIKQYEIRCKLIPYRDKYQKPELPRMNSTPDEFTPERNVFSLASNGVWEQRLIAAKRWSLRTESISVFHPGNLYISCISNQADRLSLTATDSKVKLDSSIISDTCRQWQIKIPFTSDWWWQNLASTTVGEEKNIKIKIEPKKVSGHIKYHLEWETEAQWNSVSTVKFPGNHQVEEIDYFKTRAKAYEFSPRPIKPGICEVKLVSVLSKFSALDVDLDIFRVSESNGRLAFIRRASVFSNTAKSCTFEVDPYGEYIALISLNRRFIKPFSYRLSQSIASVPTVDEPLEEGKIEFIRKSNYAITAPGPAILLIQLYNFPSEIAEIEIIDQLANRKLEPEHNPYGEFHELSIELLERREHHLRLRAIANSKEDLRQSKLRYVLQRIGIRNRLDTLKNKVNDRFGYSEQVDLFDTSGEIQLRGEVDPTKDIVDCWYLHRATPNHKQFDKLQMKLEGNAAFLRLEVYDAYGKILAQAGDGELISCAGAAYLTVIDSQASDALSGPEQPGLQPYRIRLNLSRQNDIRTIQIESDSDRH